MWGRLMTMLGLARTEALSAAPFVMDQAMAEVRALGQEHMAEQVRARDAARGVIVGAMDHRTRLQRSTRRIETRTWGRDEIRSGVDDDTREMIEKMLDRL